VRNVSTILCRWDDFQRGPLVAEKALGMEIASRVALPYSLSPFRRCMPKIARKHGTKNVEPSRPFGEGSWSSRHAQQRYSRREQPAKGEWES